MYHNKKGAELALNIIIVLVIALVVLVVVLFLFGFRIRGSTETMGSCEAQGGTCVESIEKCGNNPIIPETLATNCKKPNVCCVMKTTEKKSK